MKFVVTQELGKLGRWLRMLGFDTSYYKSRDSARLVILSLQEKRIVVTRSRSSRLPQKAAVVVSSDNLFGQLKELFQEKSLKVEKDKIFSRCTLCNNLLEPIEKEKVKEKVPKAVYKEKINFTNCSNCGKIYWPGSHWRKIQEVVKLLNC